MPITKIEVRDSRGEFHIFKGENKMEQKEFTNKILSAKDASITQTSNGYYVSLTGEVSGRFIQIKSVFKTLAEATNEVEEFFVS